MHILRCPAARQALFASCRLARGGSFFIVILIAHVSLNATSPFPAVVASHFV